MDDSNFNVSYLNARSLHKHIDDVRNDFNLCYSDLAITETRFLPCDPDEMYMIDRFRAMFRNDSSAFIANSRPFGGTAIYSKVPFLQGYPRIHNINGVEFTVVKVSSYDNYTVIGVYRSPKVSIRHLCAALNDILTEHGGQNTIIMGDFNVNWLVEQQRRPLYSLMIEDNGYQQLISSCTTDYNTLIDHVYSNVLDGDITLESGVLETYFSDHKIIWISFN